MKWTGSLTFICFLISAIVVNRHALADEPDSSKETAHDLVVACSLPAGDERKDKCDKYLSAGLMATLMGVSAPQTVHTPDWPCKTPHPMDTVDSTDWYRSAIVKWLVAHPESQLQLLDEGLYAAYMGVFRCKVSSE